MFPVVQQWEPVTLSKKRPAPQRKPHKPDEEEDDPKDRRLSRTSFRKKDKSFVVTGGIADKMREADYEGKARERAGYSELCL